MKYMWNGNECHVCMHAKSTVACQAPLFMGFSSQEYWSGLPYPPPGIFATQGFSLHLLWLLHCRLILYHWATREAQWVSWRKPNQGIGVGSAGGWDTLGFQLHLIWRIWYRAWYVGIGMRGRGLGKVTALIPGCSCSYCYSSCNDPFWLP